MQRLPQPRRRSSYSPQLCAAATVFLLLLSLSILHTRISSTLLHPFPFRSSSPNLSSFPNFNPFFDDADNDAFDGGADDRIDELDVIEDEKKLDADSADDAESDDNESSSGLFWDHATGVARISFDRPKSRADAELPLEDQYGSKVAFGSDDEPVDADVRAKLASIRRVEDALLLKVGGNGEASPMRDGWARWLEGKGDFLRRDRMLRSNLELLNPKNHPLLQDPDITGITGLTRGDRLMQKVILMEMQKTELAVADNNRMDGRRTLHLKEMVGENEKKQELDGHDRRWGNFPGLDSKLGFSEFMDRFLGGGHCSLRVFMVWNSPSWSFGVRHQRGLESVLYHHTNACLVVFSEVMELNFFRDFVKDGFRVAVVMPNLDELLKDTPVHIFASVWFEWRKTKHYPLHYSELIRLAVLYKYGGVYLDSDVIILKPLNFQKNFLGIEDQQNGYFIFNGAVMAFESHSIFLMECLREFYSTYDDTLLRWNGADLINRVIDRLHSKGGKSLENLGITIEPPTTFFPISSVDILRFFTAALDESEKVQPETQVYYDPLAVSALAEVSLGVAPYVSTTYYDVSGAVASSGPVYSNREPSKFFVEYGGVIFKDMALATDHSSAFKLSVDSVGSSLSFDAQHQLLP